LALSSSPAQLGTRAGARASARFSTAAKAKFRNILRLFLIRTLKRRKGRDATLINPRLNFSSWRDEWSHEPWTSLSTFAIKACFRAGSGLEKAMPPRPFRLQATRVVFAFALAVLFPTVTTGYSFTALYAFGDSLTDTGRNPPSETEYYQNRYSNGPLWIEYLSTLLGIPYNPANNLAFSGSTTSDLSSQIAGLPALTNPQSALFAVWSGANDFLQAQGNGENDAAWSVTISNAVLNITNAVTTLYTQGAREVILANLPNLGQLPVLGSTGTFTNYIDSKVQLFNSTLGTAATNLMPECPGLRIYFMNANQETLSVYESPATYGFTVVSTDALQDPNLADKSFNGPGENYLFWDPVHPTTKMHARLAALAYELVGVKLNLAASSTIVDLTVSNLYPGFQYSIQGSTNLLTWTNYETFTASSTNLDVHVTNTSAHAAYYRVLY
jgi:phospholipase/lecithinase/hemolysin